MREPIAARMLLLQSAPSFEWRSLARWLARAGARVAARTRVSETRFRDRFDGLSARALDTLDRDLLSQFDLVIADGAALGVLDDASRSALLDSSGLPCQLLTSQKPTSKKQGTRFSTRDT